MQMQIVYQKDEEGYLEVRGMDFEKVIRKDLDKFIEYFFKFDV